MDDNRHLIAQLERQKQKLVSIPESNQMLK